MEQKEKITIFGLIFVTLVFGIIALFVTNSKQSAERQLQAVVNEKNALQEQIQGISNERVQLLKKIQQFESQISGLAQERDSLQQKYTEVNGARQGFVEQISALKNRISSLESDLKKSKESVTEKQDSLQFSSPNDAKWSDVLKTKTDLGIQLDIVKDQLNQFRISNESLVREKNSLKMEITSLNNTNQELKRQMDYNRKIIDNLTSDFVREKNDKNQLEENIVPIRNENEALKRQIRSLSDRKIDLERKYTEIEGKYNQLQDRFNEMRILLKDKLLQIEKSKRELFMAQGDLGAGKEKRAPVELAPIVVKANLADAPAAGETSSQGLTGAVTAINRENNFLVINIGKEVEVKPGDIFKVYRAGKVVAGLKVIEARQAMAACDIVNEIIPVKVGDQVR